MADKTTTYTIPENREYRSDVFSMLMMIPEYALDVYNTLNHTNYDDPALIVIKTLEKGISLSISNDSAFIINTDINIYEHQSTYNPNMPLRSLIYFVEIVKALIVNKDLLGRKLITIPRPHFVVFYNGKEKRPETEILKLSDAFEAHADSPELELMCTVYNINPDNNKDIMNSCWEIEQYTQFVEVTRNNILMNVEKPLEVAINYCIEHNILRDFLSANKNEVLKSMTIDMTFEAREEIIKKEYQAEIERSRAEIEQSRAEIEQLKALLQAHNIEIPKDLDRTLTTDLNK